MSERKRFHYQAKDAQGNLEEGESFAESAEMLRRRLEERGYVVKEVKEAAPRTEAEEAAARAAAKDATRRVVQVILEQAIKDKASEIRISLEPEETKQKIVVRYVIEGTEHAIMAIPVYVWAGLHAEIAAQAGVAEAGAGELPFSYADKAHRLPAKVGSERIEITIPAG